MNNLLGKGVDDEITPGEWIDEWKTFTDSKQGKKVIPQWELELRSGN